MKWYRYVFTFKSITMDDKDELIKELTDENAKLKDELDATKEHLKKYTAPSRNRQFYQNNKDVLKKRVREYQIRTNYKSKSKSTPEQIKEYNRRAYLKRKENLKKELEENQNV